LNEEQKKGSPVENIPRAEGPYSKNKVGKKGRDEDLSKGVMTKNGNGIGLVSGV